MSNSVLVEPSGENEDGSYLKTESSEVKTEIISNLDIEEDPSLETLQNGASVLDENEIVNGIKNERATDLNDHITSQPLENDKTIRNQNPDRMMGQSLPKVNGIPAATKSIEKVLYNSTPEDVAEEAENIDTDACVENNGTSVGNDQTNGHDDLENSLDGLGDLNDQDKPYKCHICSKLFSRNSSLKCHIRLHIEGPENILRSASTQPATEADSADGGEGVAGKNNSAVTNNNNDEKDAGSADEDSSPHNCVLCDSQFSKKSALKSHIIQFHVEAFQAEEQPAKEAADRRPSNDAESSPCTTDKGYACVICDQRFSRKSSLIMHYKNHPIERTSKNEIPERLQHDGVVLPNMTVDIVHDESLLTPFKVDSVVKPAEGRKRSGTLSRSQTAKLAAEESVEGDDKQYKCYICDKQFSRNSSLVWHIQFHETNMYSKTKKSDMLAQDGAGEDASGSSNELKCHSCNKAFETKASLKKHMLCHSKSDFDADVTDEPAEPFAKNTIPDENGLFKCELCPKLFETARRKNIHCAHAHRRNNGAQTPITPVDEVAAPPGTPLIVTEDGRYQCNLCERTFERPKGLYRHLGYHRSRDPQPSEGDDRASDDIDLSVANDLDATSLETDFSCAYCHKDGFKTRKAMRLHVAHAHRDLMSEVSDVLASSDGDVEDEEAEEEEEEVVDEEVNDSEAADQFECEMCDRVFHSKRARSIHLVHGHKINGKYLADPRSAPPKELYPEAGSFECSFCERGFDSSRALNIHASAQHKDEMMAAKEVVEGNEFQCIHCGRNFESARAMNIHITAQHRGERATSDDSPYNCDVCEKSFDGFNSVREHLQGVCGTAALINGKHMYVCKECPKMFAHPKSMVRHIRDHRNANNADSSQLSGSVATEETDEECKDYKCAFCPKSFSNVKALSGHVKIHQRSPGEMNQTDPLDISQERPVKIYTCKFCGRSFNSCVGYAGHMKAHRGQKMVKLEKVEPPPEEEPVPLEQLLDEDVDQDMVEEQGIQDDSMQDMTDFMCVECNETFSCQEELSQHERIHTLPVSTALSANSIICQYCARPFNGEQSLKTHLYRFHRSKIMRGTSEAISRAISLTPEKGAGGAANNVVDEVHTCDLCNQTFPHYKELRRHSMIGCNGLPSRKRPYSASREMLKCQHCAQEFLLHCHLQKHLKSRCNAVDLCNEPMENAEKYEEGVGGPPSGKRARKSTFVSPMYEYGPVGYHKCDECGKSCTSKQGLQRHLLSHKMHDKLQPPASRLKFSFRKNGEMVPEKQPDMVEAQFRDKPYECVYCEKCFGAKNILLEHVRTHAEANELDEEDFEKYINLHAGEHFVVQNPEGDEEHFIFEQYDDDEGYQCTECRETYHDKLQMIIHMTHHLNSKLPNGGHKSLLIKADSTLLAPYQCSFCDERFINKSYRIQHLRKYHSEEILHCDVCGKLFLCKENLRLHCRQHTADTRYRCEFCRKCFTSKWFLKRHAKRQCVKKPSSAAAATTTFWKPQKEEIQIQPQEVDPLSNIHENIKQELTSQLIMYKCEQCGLESEIESEVENHSCLHAMKAISCNYCLETFLEDQDLIAHMQTHDGESCCNTSVVETKYVPSL